ncbi:pyridoxal phosphate-dependent transferase [Radiomyces spectabilis]|uniref:pyridoxal phosphate-dependent transferase n=1 Tax=Radiomyces spectabilis TaxID=64574 RepID=UPI002220D549|nr:pyridoxal phosphate-dependent transferase [Radiomyces spectabilis]KAI8379279.1 pyridoxal phosphate-dependent transferase [Radiomyces spectabilis]
MYIVNGLKNNGVANPHAKVYDLRSDTETAPTEEMFEVMKQASRADDVFQEDSSCRELEEYVADLCGHEAGLFCASGTMTNQLGLLTHLRCPPHSVVCDSRAHVFLLEAGGISFHARASVSPVIASNGVHVTKEEIEANVIAKDLYSAPTKVVSLENTLSGMIFPLSEIRRISDMARHRGLAMHLDGARLWNASEETGIPLKEYGKNFDSMSLCLSKGVGAPIGSILVGNADFIDRARHHRKLFGGGWRQAGPLAAVAKYCIENVVPTMKSTHQLARRLADGLVAQGIDLQIPVHTNMIMIDTSRAGIDIQNDLLPPLLEHNIRIGGMGTKARIVLHHQIDQVAVDTFLNVVSQVIAAKADQPLDIPVRRMVSMMP